MDKKKIAIVTNSMKGGGAERFISYLLNGLKDKYEIHLILSEKEIEYDIPSEQIIFQFQKNRTRKKEAASVLDFPRLLGEIPLNAIRLKRYCKENGIDTVVSFLERPNFVACFAKLIGIKSKVLISERTHTPSYHARKTGGKLSSLMVKWLYPFADGIITNSIGSRIGLEKSIGVKNQYFLVNNAIDIELIQNKSTETVESKAFNKFVFVYLAGFRDGKNHSVLMEAFAKLSNKETHLLLIGKGDKLQDALEKAKTLGISERVFFESETKNPFKYLVNSDCFVMTSDFEGFPNVLIEAMACNLPIISTDCHSGPRELLANRKSYEKMLSDQIEIAEFGILVPIGNAELISKGMSKMLNDKKLRESYRSKSQSMLREFRLEKVLKDFCEIIEK